MNTTIIFAAALAGLTIITFLGFNEMCRRAKADPIHAQHD